MITHHDFVLPHKGESQDLATLMEAAVSVHAASLSPEEHAKSVRERTAQLALASGPVEKGTIGASGFRAAHETPPNTGAHGSGGAYVGSEYEARHDQDSTRGTTYLPITKSQTVPQLGLSSVQAIRDTEEVMGAVGEQLFLGGLASGEIDLVAGMVSRIGEGYNSASSNPLPMPAAGETHDGADKIFIRATGIVRLAFSDGAVADAAGVVDGRMYPRLINAIQSILRADINASNVTSDELLVQAVRAYVNDSYASYHKELPNSASAATDVIVSATTAKFSEDISRHPTTVLAALALEEDETRRYQEGLEVMRSCLGRLDVSSSANDHEVAKILMDAESITAQYGIDEQVRVREYTHAIIEALNEEFEPRFMLEWSERHYSLSLGELIHTLVAVTEESRLPLGNIIDELYSRSAPDYGHWKSAQQQRGSSDIQGAGVRWRGQPLQGTRAGARSLLDRLFRRGRTPVSSEAGTEDWLR